MEEIPNVETLEAMAEVEEMIKAGNGQHFHGTAEEFTEMLLAEDFSFCEMELQKSMVTRII